MSENSEKCWSLFPKAHGDVLKCLVFSFAGKPTLRRKFDSSVCLSIVCPPTHGRLRGPTLTHTHSVEGLGREVQVQPSWIHHTPQVSVSPSVFLFQRAAVVNTDVTGVRQVKGAFVSFYWFNQWNSTQYQYRIPFFYLISVFTVWKFGRPSWIHMSNASFNIFFLGVGLLSCVVCRCTCQLSQLYKGNLTEPAAQFTHLG